MKPDVEDAFMIQINKNTHFLILTVLLGLLQFRDGFAQTDIPKGTWRSHFSFSNVSLVEKAGNKIFGATKYGLTFYDLEDKSLNKFSKIDGLSDVDITAMAYDASKNRLAIGYRNGNIDVMTTDEIVNYRTLLESEILEDKKVNDLSFKGETLIISTAFGASVLEFQNKLIRESYSNLGNAGKKLIINASVVFDDKIFLGSQGGVLMSDPTPGLNLQDFNNWEHFDGSEVAGKDIIHLAQYMGKMYACSKFSLFGFESNFWTNIPLNLNIDEFILTTRTGSHHLTVLTNQRIFLLDTLNNISTVLLTGDLNPLDVIEVNQNEFWLGDSEKGLTRLLNSDVSHFELNGAYDGNMYRLKLLDKSVMAFPVLDRNITKTTSNGKGYSIYNQGKWINKTPEQLNGFDNISGIEIQNNDTLLSSFGRGILNVSKGVIYDENTSTLTKYGSTDNVLVSGLEIDAQNKVWITNYGDWPLQSIDAEGSWNKYSFASSESKAPQKIVLSNYGQVWMTLGHNKGAGIQTFDPENGAQRIIDITNGGNSTDNSLPSNDVFDIAFDKTDLILMTTELGIAYFPYTYGIIDDASINVSLPIYENNYLFRNVTVTSMAIDGGNRKWIGTDQGLWLFDDSFDKLVLNFDKDNSPLPSNYIVDLVIHPTSGEVFIATDQGLVSYRSDATEGKDFHQNVKIYPNPVLPDYQGMVGIDGLVNDAILKITTVTGRLVREIHAAGGGASWNIADYNGRRVNTGVYLVFSSNTDGSETFVGKIAVVN